MGIEISARHAVGDAALYVGSNVAFPRQSTNMSSFLARPASTHNQVRRGYLKCP